MVDSRFYECSPMRKLITLMMVVVVCVGLVVSPRVPSAGAAECKGEISNVQWKNETNIKDGMLLVTTVKALTFSSTGKLTRARNLAINSL